jgi:ATP-dependent Lhr-like helicase
LARIHRYTLEALRPAMQPISAAEFLRFAAHWQHVHPSTQLSGPEGVRAAIAQLAGFHAPAASWERDLLPARVRGYRPDWLDMLCWSGEIAWGRLRGEGRSAARFTPITLLPRSELAAWKRAEPANAEVSGRARPILQLLQQRGALFYSDLAQQAQLLPEPLEEGLAELVGAGLLSCDSFGGLRQIFPRRSPNRRGSELRRAPRRVVGAPLSAGRWSLLHAPDIGDDERVERIARTLLARWGCVFRRLLDRERVEIPWRELLRVYRRLELRGEIHGGRFVARFSGEQFALPTAVEQMRRLRREEPTAAIEVAAADPLNLLGILTPDERVASARRKRVSIG